MPTLGLLVNTLHIQESRALSPFQSQPLPGGLCAWEEESGGALLVGPALVVSAAPASRPLPQAEAAGRLEVVTLLRRLQGGADGLAPEGPPGGADHASEELVALQLDPGSGAMSKGQA